MNEERAPHSECGSGLVELALVLPVVLILTLAIVQFGVLGFAASAADNAARQGARLGSVAQVNPAGQAVALAPGGVVGSELTIRVTYQARSDLLSGIHR